MNFSAVRLRRRAAPSGFPRRIWLRLSANIRRALQTRGQITLSALLADYPLEQGLAELATYLSLATQEQRSAIDDSQHEIIEWVDAGGNRRRATLPLLIFSA